MGRGHKLDLDSDDTKWFGRALRVLRQEADMSLEDLATATGYGKPSLSAIERGLRLPSQEKFPDICEALGVTEPQFRFFLHDLSRKLRHLEVLEEARKITEEEGVAMPGLPGSHMDQQFCADISSMARSLNRIANCMEAAEARARMLDPTSLDDIERMGAAVGAIKRAFAGMEEQTRAAVKEVGDGQSER